MTEPALRPDDETTRAEGDTEAAGPIPTELVFAVHDALSDERFEDAAQLIEPLHAADLADLIETLPPEDRGRLVHRAGREIEPEVLTYLDPAVREQIIDEIGPVALARMLSRLDSDDAVEIFEDLDDEGQRRILGALPRAYRTLLEESLSYPEDSAGRLMQREVVAIPSAWTVGETIDFTRDAEELPDDFYDIYVVDPKHRPIGKLPLSRIMRSRRPVRVAEIMDREVRTLPVELDQEEVAYQFGQYNLASAPVVDEAGRLIGVVTVDDIVHVVSEEAEEDLLRLSGVRETHLYTDLFATARSRIVWLMLNMATALVAATVIGQFDEEIAAVVALAILLPIVPALGGNAGTQTLTVAVRSIAMKDLVPANVGRYVRKEVLVSLINGVSLAALAGAIAAVWFHWEIGLVIAGAMLVTMLVSGLAGTLIPLGLDRAGIDPAVSSSVFLTALTDTLGFLTFLGFASLFLF